MATSCITENKNRVSKQRNILSIQASLINTIEYNAEKYWGRQILDGTFELPKNTDLYSNDHR